MKRARAFESRFLVGTLVAVVLSGCGGTSMPGAVGGDVDASAPGAGDGGAGAADVAASPSSDVAAPADVAAPHDVAVSKDAPSPIDLPAATDVASSASDGAAAPDAPVQTTDVASLPSPDGAGAPDAPAAPHPGRDIDILFVIDNSPSMQEEQDNLRRNFPAFMNELKKARGGLPNIHVGVVTSDLGAGSTPIGTGACARPGGDRAIFQHKPGCGLDPNAAFIASYDNGTRNNFGQADIAQVFSCIADVGVRGCGYEHQLQATRVALYEAITPENRGFLRADAALAIILITDEDDCSAETNSTLFADELSYPGSTASFRCAYTGHVCNGQTPPLAALDVPLESCRANDAGRLINVKEMVESVRALKKRPAEQIFVSGIFGWPATEQGARYRWVNVREGIDLASICESTSGLAMPGLRMKQFVEGFNDSGFFTTICQPDLGPALAQFGRRVGEMVGP